MDSTAKALKLGAMWTAKWLADNADEHLGTETEHLVRSARRALRDIESAKARLTPTPS
jgi:hypothetical protein